MERINEMKFSKLSNTHSCQIKGGMTTDMTDVCYEESDYLFEKDNVLTTGRKKVSRGRSTSTGWYYTDVQFFHKGSLQYSRELWTPYKI